MILVRSKEYSLQNIFYPNTDPLCKIPGSLSGHFNPEFSQKAEEKKSEINHSIFFSESVHRTIKLYCFLNQLPKLYNFILVLNA